MKNGRIPISPHHPQAEGVVPVIEVPVTAAAPATPILAPRSQGGTGLIKLIDDLVDAALGIGRRVARQRGRAGRDRAARAAERERQLWEGEQRRQRRTSRPAESLPSREEAPAPLEPLTSDQEVERLAFSHAALVRD